MKKLPGARAFLASLAVLCVLGVTACGAAASPQPCPAAPADQPAQATGCLQLAVSGDGRQLHRGDVLTLTVTQTNTCAQAVGGQAPCGYDVKVFDSGGRPVVNPPARACPALAVLLQPGQVISRAAGWTVPADFPTGAYRASPGEAYGAFGFAVC